MIELLLLGMCFYLNNTPKLASRILVYPLRTHRVWEILRNVRFNETGHKYKSLVLAVSFDVMLTLVFESKIESLCF